MFCDSIRHVLKSWKLQDKIDFECASLCSGNATGMYLGGNQFKLAIPSEVLHSSPHFILG
jgi:hypothetical protein